MQLSLHEIHADSIELALDRARQYRALLDPEIAESICLDVLHIEPNNQQALILYILALSDQLHHHGKEKQVKAILAAIEKLDNPYQKLYYTGLLNERHARHILSQTMGRGFAYDYFIEALTCYQQAEAIRPEHNDEAILRWNSCIRTIKTEKLTPRADDDNTLLNMES